MTISVMLSKLSEGMVVSLLIFAVTLIFSLPLGLLVSFGRMAKNPVIRAVFKVYISIMRGTPLMLQLMVIYFGPFRYPEYTDVEEYRGSCWIYFKLRRLLCGDLSRWYRIYTERAV